MSKEKDPEVNAELAVKRQEIVRELRGLASNETFSLTGDLILRAAEVFKIKVPDQAREALEDGYELRVPGFGFLKNPEERLKAAAVVHIKMAANKGTKNG